jgi:hypothetical protein
MLGRQPTGRHRSPREPGSVPAWPARILFAGAMLLGVSHAAAEDLQAESAGALRAKQAELGPRLGDSPLHRPLVVESSESSDRVQGDVYALIDRPFGAVREALAAPERWCDVLILHLNTKSCRASPGESGGALAVRIGKRYDQPVADAYPVEFSTRVAADSSEYFDVLLDARSGPAGTREFRIRLEAVPLPDGRTFMHLGNSFEYNFLAWTALQAYLMTAGRGKVGFTSAGTTPDGRPDYVSGVRGLAERNTMRYYLAVEAYLGAMSVPPDARFEKRLRDWFAATERFPRQLHEVDLPTYLEVKRREVAR